VAHIRQGCRRIISEEEITEVFKELKDCKRCRNSIKYDKNRGSAVLGSGAFGTVFRARLGVKPVALKVMKATEMNYLQQKNRFVRELIALHLFLAGKENGLKHPNVLEFLGWSIKTKPDAKVGYGMTLILPLAPEGSLGYKLFENPVLEEGEVIRCALHVLRALKFLHSHRILHRDLKPENVLLFKEGGGRVYKLCDFGVAAVHTHTTQGTAVGTLPYMAPELRTKEKYNEAVDMYSFGVMLWELVSGAGPRKWPNFDNIEAKRANKYPPWDIVNKCRKEGEIFQKLKRLAQTYCKFKPTERENESRQDVIAKFEQWLREIKQPIKKKDLPCKHTQSYIQFDEYMHTCDCMGSHVRNAYFCLCTHKLFMYACEDI